MTALHRLGIDTGEMKGEIFSLRNEFHRLFHSVDVEKVRSRTAGFQQRLGKINNRVTAVENQLADRKFWGGIVVVLLALGGILALILHKTYKE